MQVLLDKLISIGRILSGFNGATTLTVGDIDLPVKVRSITQQVLFLVVEDLGPYNAIVGLGLAACYEGNTVNLPSNDQLPNQRRKN